MPADRFDYSDYNRQDVCHSCDRSWQAGFFQDCKRLEEFKHTLSWRASAFLANDQGISFEIEPSKRVCERCKSVYHIAEVTKSDVSN